METIVRQVRDATGRMAEISAASREQSMRAGQVTHAMSESIPARNAMPAWCRKRRIDRDSAQRGAGADVQRQRILAQQQHEPAAA